MTEKLALVLRRKTAFISPNLLQFFFIKLKEGGPAMLILVMTTLHYLIKFQETHKVTAYLKKITRPTPKSFAAFIENNKLKLRPCRKLAFNPIVFFGDSPLFPD